MNLVFFVLIAGSVGWSGWQVLHGQPQAMESLSRLIVTSAESAVPLAFGLIGTMSLFLGLMKVAEAGGLLDFTARLLSPALRRLFPEVPPQHPAFASMMMNVSANMLGLGNAATPFGIRAMEQLQDLNPHKDRASNAQVLFLAINTASVTLLPTSVIALRASAGAADPSAVIVPTLAATFAASLAAFGLARGLQGLFPLPPLPRGAKAAGVSDTLPHSPCHPPLPGWQTVLCALGLVGVVAAFLVGGKDSGPWIIPVLMVGLLGYGVLRRVPVYEIFVEGARDGFTIAVRILPYLVAILVAVGMARQSGALDLLLRPLSWLGQWMGIPPEALAMGVVRTLSGSGSFGLLAAQMKDPAIGPDSPLAIMMGSIYASSETTFYVIAVYFGAIAIRRTRHALAVGLLADAVGLCVAVWCTQWLYGGG